MREHSEIGGKPMDYVGRIFSKFIEGTKLKLGKSPFYKNNLPFEPMFVYYMYSRVKSFKFKLRKS